MTARQRKAETAVRSAVIRGGALVYVDGAAVHAGTVVDLPAADARALVRSGQAIIVDHLTPDDRERVRQFVLRPLHERDELLTRVQRGCEDPMPFKLLVCMLDAGRSPSAAVGFGLAEDEADAIANFSTALDLIDAADRGELPDLNAPEPEQWTDGDD